MLNKNQYNHDNFKDYEEEIEKNSTLNKLLLLLSLIFLLLVLSVVLTEVILSTEKNNDVNISEYNNYSF